MCAKLAQNAVHGAMAGYTAFSTGVVRNAVSFIPIKTINEAGVNKLSFYDRGWQRLLGSIRQRKMVNPDFDAKALAKIKNDEETRATTFENIKQRIIAEDREREIQQKTEVKF
mmetsp:Transcript_14178/g.24096  ORF Transcript_14178/g.24096 Transcript_14178/m.24096 type:complete len:113 (+) Transcript_14178:1629-1967(+)